MNLKKLIETRNAKLEEMKTILEKVETETRAMTPEEQERFDALETEVKSMKSTIAILAGSY